MDFQHPIFIVNQMTAIEKQEDDFILRGNVSTDHGLIIDAQLLIFHEASSLFFIRPIDMDIDFEADEDSYVFNYKANFNVQNIAANMLKNNKLTVPFNIALRVQFKGSDEVQVVTLTKRNRLDEESFNSIIENKIGKKVIYFSFDVNEEGVIYLDGRSFEKEQASYLAERSRVLK